MVLKGIETHEFKENKKGQPLKEGDGILKERRWSHPSDLLGQRKLKPQGLHGAKALRSKLKLGKDQKLQETGTWKSRP